MKINFKDVLLRAFKTFWQAAVSYIILNIANLNPFDGTADRKVWGSRLRRSPGAPTTA